ncbi:MAG: MmcQ/YjbR family DNA-binding protein [Clostridia bacterium]|nr:MmcQ/YjbR family DNA-binding protein [Clostridia bacterium]
MKSLRKFLIDYAESTYGTKAEYPWESAPGYAVLRHGNGKWYCVIMDISESKLGLKGDRLIDVMNVKCDPFLLGTFLSRDGYFPPYHMTKNSNWITVSLDGKVDIEQVNFMLDMSYEIIDKKKK